MTKGDESKIRREGFPITSDDAKHLLDFIKIHDPRHDMIEPDLFVKLELLSKKYYLRETKPNATPKNP